MPSVYLTSLRADAQVVPAGDSRAAFLAWREGTVLDQQRLDAIRPGLAKEVRAAGQSKAARTPEPDVEEPAEGPEEKAVEEVEDKAVEAPAENKSRRRAR